MIAEALRQGAVGIARRRAPLSCVMDQHHGEVELDRERPEFGDNEPERAVVVLVAAVQLGKRVYDQHLRPPLGRQFAQTLHGRGRS